MCINCGDCMFDEKTDTCVIYTGENYPRFGIVSGQKYSQLTISLLSELEKYMDQTTNLKCLCDDSCNEFNVKIPEAVQVIVDKLCNLSSKDINYSGQKYCIGNGSISSDAIKLLGKSFNYTIDSALNGTSIYYDLSGVGKSLSSDYRVSRINSIVSGNNKSGKNIIVDSNKYTVGVTVPNDRFPVYVDIDMRVATKTGEVKLLKTIAIPSPVPGTYIAQLDVKDFGTDDVTYNLESFLEAVAAQTCYNTSKIETYSELDLVGCDKIQYKNKDILSIISTHSAILCDILNQLEALNKISFSIQKDDCGFTSYSGDIQTAFDTISSACTSLRQDFNNCNNNTCNG